MLSCREVAVGATDIMQGSLTRGRRLSTWLHLRLCPNCREFLRQLTRTIVMTKRIGATPPPARPVEDELVALFAEQVRVRASQD